MKPMNINKLLKKTIEAEKELLKTSFLAPLVSGGEVRTRINGLVYQFQVVGEELRAGWFILQPLDQYRAQIVAEASISRRSAYLSQFPVWRGILIRKLKDPSFIWLAYPANLEDSSRRFGINDLAPVYFIESARTFDVIIARFDGANLWYETPDRQKDPAIADYLRKSLREEVRSDELRFPNLTFEEKSAYSLLIEKEQELRKSFVQTRLEQALGHAHAKLLSYIEHPDSYLVTWEAENGQFQTVVKKDNLTVVSAGICLEGRDQDFDLTSIVGVMKEEGAYWYE